MAPHSSGWRELAAVARTMTTHLPHEAPQEAGDGVRPAGSVCGHGRIHSRVPNARHVVSAPSLHAPQFFTAVRHAPVLHTPRRDCKSGGRAGVVAGGCGCGGGSGFGNGGALWQDQDRRAGERGNEDD